MNQQTPGIALFPVASDQLAAAGYDEPSHTLAIQFHGNERTYRYHNVPLGIWDGFQKAENVGKYFAGSIKGKFGFSRIEVDGEVSKVEPAPAQQEAA